MSTNTKIVKASLILMSASILGHILSLGKEILVAKYFGITKAMDAFYAAITIPNTINIVLLSAFGAIFIPFFINLKIKENKEANYVASVVINNLVLFLVFISVFLYIFAPFIIKYGFRGFNAETAVLSIKILRLICFTLVLSGIIGIMTGILNAYQHFTYPAFTGLFITVCTILFLVFSINKFGIFTLAYGLLTGLIFQMLFLIPVTIKKGYKHSFSFNWNHPSVKNMFFLAILYFIVIIGFQINILVDRIMASNLGMGNIAAIGYAVKLVGVPTIIFSSSITTAVFPYFSYQMAENKLDEMKHSLAKSIRMSGFILIPLTFMLIIFSKPIIQLLFQRGAFTQEATDLTSIILICYSFQLFFYATAMILGRVFLVLRDMTSLLKITTAGVIMNILLNFIFINIITPPAAGIALSTSVIYLITMLLLFHYLKRKMFYLNEKYILNGLTKMGVSAGIMGACVFLLFKLWSDSYIVGSLVQKVLSLGILGLISGIIFIGVSVLLKLEEVDKLINLVPFKF